MGSSKFRSIITPHILYDNRTKVAIKRKTLQQAVANDATAVFSTFSNVDTETIANIQSNLYNQELKAYVSDRFEFLNGLRECQTRIAHDRVLQIVRMEAFELPAWLRVVVTSGDDPIVNKRFGQQALYELENGIKGLKEELESRGRGIDVRSIIRKLKYE